MSQEVFIQKCGQCGEEVYGIFTSAFEDALTILYACPQCGQVWSEDKPLSAGAGAEKGKKESETGETSEEK